MGDNTELIAELRERAQGHTGGPDADRLWRAADALESAAPRVVRTRKECDALPGGTVLRDRFGTVAERVSYYGSWTPIGLQFEHDIALPASVLFTPTESGEPQ